MITKLALITLLSSAIVRQELVISKIKLIAPSAKRETAVKVAKGLKHCKDLDANLVLSIIRVESNYEVNAVNKASSDYGLMQVNEWHVKKKGLDKSKLLTDVSYNMTEGCKILSYFVNRYSVESEAIARYNCGVRKQCIKWDEVRNYVKKVLTFKRKLDSMDVQNK